MKYCGSFFLIFYLFLITNLFAVPMVEVSVDIIEIKRTFMNNKGISWNETVGFKEGLDAPSYYNLQQGGNSSAEAFRVGNIVRVDPLVATLRFMMSDNTARILANPKLSTESGSQASFLVGGEIPVPVSSPQGTSIEWKTYGVNLQIRPNVLERQNKISAMIQISISDLDYANSVKVEGYDIPALLNRSANSKVTVDDGGTVVIAGLKHARKENTVQKVPLLSSIPLIGWFFKSNSDKDSDTSMVVFVTFKTVDNNSASNVI